jgi:hypothetical protein
VFLPLFQFPDSSVSTSVLNPAATPELEIKFGTNPTIGWQFPTFAYTPQEIDAALVLTSFEFVGKKLQDYDGPSIVSNFIAGNWVVTKTGTGATALYSISPGFSGSTLFELFITGAGGSIVARPANQVARLALTGLTLNQIVQQVDTVVYWRLIDPAAPTLTTSWDMDVPLADTVPLGCELLVNLGSGAQVTKTLPFSITILASYINGTENIVLDSLTSYPAPGTIALRPLDNADLTPSAATSGNLFTDGLQSMVLSRILAGAGAGAYTATYALPTTSASDGELLLLNVELPTSANPTIQITNSTTGGTLLQTVTTPNAGAAAAYWFGIFKFSSLAGAWIKLFGAFQ